MIVLDEPDGSLLLVRQPDHAAMSAQIAAAWRRPAASRLTSAPDVQARASRVGVTCTPALLVHDT